MKKISTLFKKDPNDLGRVINEINPENQWVFDGHSIATRKFDGTAVAIVNLDLYKRYDVKHGRSVPPGAIPCQEPDEVTGHHPHWIACDRTKPEDKHFFEAFDKLISGNTSKKSYEINGTYELCGTKVQGNPENIEGHELIRHGEWILNIPDLSFESLKEYLSDPANDIEGIVFYHTMSEKLCKLRKKDFGIKRLKKS